MLLSRVTPGDVGSSRCRLKSPRISSLPEVVASEITRFSNSSRKPGTLDAGGLYIKTK